ncbi:MAG: hypothetical protein AAF493_11865 [Pseudomonadota bacterium]
MTRYAYCVPMMILALAGSPLSAKTKAMPLSPSAALSKSLPTDIPSEEALDLYVEKYVKIVRAKTGELSATIEAGTINDIAKALQPLGVDVVIHKSWQSRLFYTRFENLSVRKAAKALFGSSYVLLDGQPIEPAKADEKKAGDEPTVHRMLVRLLNYKPGAGPTLVQLPKHGATKEQIQDAVAELQALLRTASPAEARDILESALRSESDELRRAALTFARALEVPVSEVLTADVPEAAPEPDTETAANDNADEPVDVDPNALTPEALGDLVDNAGSREEAQAILSTALSSDDPALWEEALLIARTRSFRFDMDLLESIAFDGDVETRKLAIAEIADHRDYRTAADVLTDIVASDPDPEIRQFADGYFQGLVEEVRWHFNVNLLEE